MPATWTPRAVDLGAPNRPEDIRMIDVDCPTEGGCVAVGYRHTVAGVEAVIAHQSGTTWNQIALGRTVRTLFGVSCRATDDCTVLGDPVDLHLGADGVTVLPNVFTGAKTDSSQAVIDCARGSGCLRVGPTQSRWWNGTTWSAPVALPSGFSTSSRQLSCTSPTCCLLLSTDQAFFDWGVPRFVWSTVWDGTSWSAPVVFQYSRSYSLDCPSSTLCFAGLGTRQGVGTSTETNAPPTIARWNGSAWSTESITFPGPTPGEPPIVSCASASSCTALWPAGTRTPALTYLGRWNGASWTVTASDAPAATIDISCAGATCVGVGATGGVAVHDGRVVGRHDAPHPDRAGGIVGIGRLSIDDVVRRHRHAHAPR